MEWLLLFLRLPYPLLCPLKSNLGAMLGVHKTNHCTEADVLGYIHHIP